MLSEQEVSQQTPYEEYKRNTKAFVEYVTGLAGADALNLMESWQLFLNICESYTKLYSGPIIELGVREIVDFLKAKDAKIESDRHLIDIGLRYFTSKTGLGQGSAPLEEVMRLGKEDRQKATVFFIKMQQAVYSKIINRN